MRTLSNVIDELAAQGATTREGEPINFSTLKNYAQSNKRLSPLQADLLIFAIKKGGLTVPRSCIKVTIGEKNAWQIKKMSDEKIKNIYPSLTKTQINFVRQIRRSNPRDAA